MDRDDPTVSKTSQSTESVDLHGGTSQKDQDARAEQERAGEGGSITSTDVPEGKTDDKRKRQTQRKDSTLHLQLSLSTIDDTIAQINDMIEDTTDDLGILISYDQCLDKSEAIKSEIEELKQQQIVCTETQCHYEDAQESFEDSDALLDEEHIARIADGDVNYIVYGDSKDPGVFYRKDEHGAFEQITYPNDINNIENLIYYGHRVADMNENNEIVLQHEQQIEILQKARTRFEEANAEYIDAQERLEDLEGELIKNEHELMDLNIQIKYICKKLGAKDGTSNEELKAELQAHLDVLENAKDELRESKAALEENRDHASTSFAELEERMQPILELYDKGDALSFKDLADTFGNKTTAINYLNGVEESAKQFSDSLTPKPDEGQRIIDQKKNEIASNIVACGGTISESVLRDMAEDMGIPLSHIEQLKTNLAAMNDPNVQVIFPEQAQTHQHTTIAAAGVNDPKMLVASFEKAKGTEFDQEAPKPALDPDAPALSPTPNTSVVV